MKKEIYHFLHPGDYPTHREPINFDQEFIHKMQAIIQSNLPKSFISYFNRKMDLQLLNVKLSQEEEKETTLFLQLVGERSGRNKEENVELILKYLIPLPPPVNRRKVRHTGKRDEIKVKEEVRIEHKILEENMNLNVIHNFKVKEEHKILESEMIHVKEEVKVERNWESFKRRKVEVIEGEIKNKKAQLEQEMKELDLKMKEIEEISSSLNEDTKELNNTHTILEQLNQKLNIYLKYDFATPFDFEKEFIKLAKENNLSITNNLQSG